MNLNELTISQASTGLRKKEFSSGELTSACLEAIQKNDGAIHAYLEVFQEEALRQAKAADDLFADVHHELPHLLGIPIAVKDNILVEGKRCTAGSRILEDYTASYDATVVRKLKQQGAIILGKTNLDEFAMGSSTEHSAFGPTTNPHDQERVPGGSSGGSAAAIAANMGIAALGSDTGGSIRQPASFCGIVGMKPTYGRVSRHGLIAMASSLDQIGPMTKTVEDTKILFDAVAGEDMFDATAIHQDSGLRVQGLEAELKNLQVGMPKEYFGEGLDEDVKRTIQAAIKKIENAGATIKEISLPHSSYALPAYYIIVPSEVSANLARFDGIRYGARNDTRYTIHDTSLYDSYSKTRAYGFGPEVKRRIMLGTYALSAGYYDAYYLKAQKVRRLIKEEFDRAFKDVDVIVGPTTPTPAFKQSERAQDPLKMYLADIYTVAINLAGLPALSLPCGIVSRDGSSLPVGLQLITPPMDDEKLFEIGKVVENLISGM